MTKEPIFMLGVGAQRSGTSWLSAQLARQDDVLISPIKELHYWDRRFRPDFFGKSRFGKKIRRVLKEDSPDFYRHPIFERAMMENGEDYYLAFFKSRLRSNHKVFGEITPSYCILPEQAFRHIRNFMPFRTKAVFIMREPVERLWSQCRLDALKARNRGRKLDPYALFDSLATNGSLYERSNYEATVQNLRAAFEEEDIFFCFYETLFTEGEVARLSRFLGVEPMRFALAENPNQGISLARPEAAAWAARRRELDHVYRFVFDRFGDVVPERWKT